MKTLIDRRVTFKLRDVVIPAAEELAYRLYGDQVVQGKVLDYSDSGVEKQVYVVVEIEGGACTVIVPTGSILGVIEDL